MDVSPLHASSSRHEIDTIILELGYPQIEIIPFDSELLLAMGQLKVLAFVVSDKLEYHVKCPKEFLINACKDAPLPLRNEIEDKGHLIKIELQEFGENFSKKQFIIISDYINDGSIKDKGDWNYDELKALYRIACLLQLHEVSKYTLEKIFKSFNKRREAPWKDFLCFGIRSKSPHIVGRCLPYLVFNFLMKVERSKTTKQWIFSRFSLIKKSVETIFNIDLVNIFLKINLKSEGHIGLIKEYHYSHNGISVKKMGKIPPQLLDCHGKLRSKHYEWSLWSDQDTELLYPFFQSVRSKSKKINTTNLSDKSHII